MLVSLREITQQAADKNCAVAGFNVFGYEDASAVIRAAEKLNAPVILMSNKDAVDYMPLEFYADLFCRLARNAKVPVCIHLDHAKSYELIARAIKAGYTSVMYDGSQLPLEENIRNTKEVVKLAKALDISVEAEIGSVGYSDPNIKIKGVYTKPEEAEIFARETGVDILAVSIGNVHRMEKQGATIQYDLLKEIQEVVPAPIVVHGSTGILDEDMKKLITYRIGKVNIGTALRMAFGSTLREEMERKPNAFDRLELLKSTIDAVEEAAYNKLKLLGF
ncbi:class II fructose-bisphosphate aldolase [Anaeromicrobium sediminis]|uniref:Fructose-bisphosphate aldolase n=1 Tax=Anaeromicrobium sediminis TaxID=1478221 RepID=A0A267MKG3_9FIRM|nr:class II fructose-bisphosphate aldolase [Anaeromicrobium sediminis]PAB59283.1 fructose-bisphosphate aldolase [Anaeromicrobium sediminis]